MGDQNIKLKSLKPILNEGDYVYCSIENLSLIAVADVIMFFREEEATTLIMRKEIADTYQLKYDYIASWISLTLETSLDEVGITAAFSKALTENNISCNVVAAYYHDHIFVDKRDAVRAMEILNADGDK